MPSSTLTRRTLRRLVTTLACSLPLAAGLFALAGPANASSTMSVAPTSLAPGGTFTISFTATRDFESSDSGMGFYAGGGPLGTLDSFTTVVSCNGPVAGSCATLAGLGYIVPTGHVALSTTVSGSLTLKVKAGTPVGKFIVRKQFGGEQTVNGPTVTVAAAGATPCRTHRFTPWWCRRHPLGQAIGTTPTQAQRQTEAARPARSLLVPSS